MDPERDDYADPDLPPPVNWSQVVVTISIILGVVGMSFIACCVVTALLSPKH